MSLNNDPTQQGGTETPQPTVNPRNAVMAQIASQAAASVADEMSTFDETTGEIHASEQQAEPQQEARPEPEQQAEPQSEPAPRMVSIVVDGQTIEVEESRIVEAGKRTLQKDHAADRRLQEAAQARQQAEAMRRQAEQQAAYVLQIAQQNGIQLQAPSPDAPQQQAQQATPVDPEALKGLVKSVVYNERAETAAEQFWREFPDIAGDNYLRQMAAAMENERLAAAAAVGEPLGDPWVAYRKHGETIREWLKQRTAPVATAASTDKTDRKRSITVAPAANARAPAPTAPKVLSVSEQIEQMRQRRQSGRTVFNQIR